MSDPIATIKEFYDNHGKKYGTGIAGAAFGLGWFFFIDAIVTAPADTKIGFTKYLPGLAATVALILINSVRLDEISSVDPWNDEGVYCRSRTWLLVAYLVCAAAIGGATVTMLTAGASGIGIASVVQVASILGGALLFFVSRSEGETGDGSYGLL
ncbi:hypothetical protein NADE_002230 [Nannochloris sp. 'desiccata']|nr:hypothetical protein KSW81_003168 [Chlorella desiccata (nom. nud.)]KAH7625012.1 hypothetical protein NADE_002230 [Chlorella desiccata (nom. nud.)]